MLRRVLTVAVVLALASVGAAKRARKQRKRGGGGGLDNLDLDAILASLGGDVGGKCQYKCADGTVPTEQKE